jgi:hypothetical protein
MFVMADHEFNIKKSRERLEFTCQNCDTMNMGDFAKGVNSVGQLYPAPTPYSDYPSPDSTWKGVADSFKQAGDAIWHAINECTDTKQENKQTH